MAEHRIELDHIILKYKTEEEWLAKDPVILEGEFAVVFDKNGNYKMGDGIKKFSELSYAISSDISVAGIAKSVDDSNIPKTT